MDDFRLKVFITAARTLSFTRTAEQLFISQPAVSKHVGELESRYKTQLFVRRGSRLELTPAGETLLTCAERLAGDYRRMEYEMSLCASAVEGELRLGASTTIAQYLLPPILARFTTRFPGVRVSMMSGNSDQVEQALCGRSIDLGMVESLSRRQGLHYTLFAPDELVLVARTGGPYARTDAVTPDRLRQIPLVLREGGSWTSCAAVRCESSMSTPWRSRATSCSCIPRPNLPGLSGSSSISPGPTADPAGIPFPFSYSVPASRSRFHFRASLRGCSLRYNLWLCRITGSCSISRQKMRSLSAKQRKSYNGFLKKHEGYVEKR